MVVVADDDDDEPTTASAVSNRSAQLINDSTHLPNAVASIGCKVEDVDDVDDDDDEDVVEEIALRNASFRRAEMCARDRTPIVSACTTKKKTVSL